jgi:hypothetical protein
MQLQQLLPLPNSHKNDNGQFPRSFLHKNFSLSGLFHNIMSFPATNTARGSNDAIKIKFSWSGVFEDPRIESVGNWITELPSHQPILY